MNTDKKKIFELGYLKKMKHIKYTLKFCVDLPMIGNKLDYDIGLSGQAAGCSAAAGAELF